MTKEELIKIVKSNTEASWQTSNILEAIESYEKDIREEVRYNKEKTREVET